MLMLVIFTTVFFLGGNESFFRGTGLGEVGSDISTGRLHFWPIAFRIFLDHPILGAGYYREQGRITKANSSRRLGGERGV